MYDHQPADIQTPTMAQPATNIQPKHLSQQALLLSQGYANIHRFMHSRRLKFSNHEHYRQAQVMIEQLRHKLQLKWEQEQDKECAMKEVVASESALLDLGNTWGVKDFSPKGADPAVEREKKEELRAMEEKWEIEMKKCTEIVEKMERELEFEDDDMTPLLSRD